MRRKIAVQRLKAAAKASEIRRIAAQAEAMKAVAAFRGAATRQSQCEDEQREIEIGWLDSISRPSLALDISQAWSEALVQSSNRTREACDKVASANAVMSEKARSLDAAAARGERADEASRRASRAYLQSQEDVKFSDAQILRVSVRP